MTRDLSYIAAEDYIIDIGPWQRPVPAIPATDEATLAALTAQYGSLTALAEANLAHLSDLNPDRTLILKVRGVATEWVHARAKAGLVQLA